MILRLLEAPCLDYFHDFFCEIPIIPCTCRVIDFVGGPDLKPGARNPTVHTSDIYVLGWNGPASLLNENFKPAIAQLVEHLTVVCSSNQMVPGSIPGGRSFTPDQLVQLSPRINMSSRTGKVGSKPGIGCVTVSESVRALQCIRHRILSRCQNKCGQKMCYTSRFVRAILAQGPC